MIIEYIKLENWRSFYCENEIFVSTGKTKNVTLIRAENGVGKTSLLAAINWCFFGILPSENEFENPKKLVNTFAVKNDGASFATVQIEFLHEKTLYRAVRRYNQKTEKTEALRLCTIEEGGEVPLNVGSYDRFINSVIPQEMAPHFFFYGEATSHYTGRSGAKKFGKAVRGILGSTVARMALKDLNKAFQDYSREAAAQTGSEAQIEEKKIEAAERRIEEAEAKLSKLDDEIETSDALVDKYDKELAGSKPAKEAQRKRGKLEAELARKQTQREKAQIQSKKWFENSITSLLAEELVQEADTVIKREDTRGKLPAPYDQKFVDEILEDELCICGRPFEKGGTEFEKIKSLLEDAGDQAVMSRVMSTSVALGKLEAVAAEAWPTFRRNNDDLSSIEQDLLRLDVELEEISKQLAENPMEDIAQKEEARARAKSNSKNASERKGAIKGQIASFLRASQEAQRNLVEQTRKSEAARRYVKRAQVAAALSARLKGRLDAEEEEARKAIEGQIDLIVQKFLRKPATVELDSDYQLRLFDEHGSELGKSTGENQLLGLAFTGAIAQYAKERKELGDDILLPGTIAPLVVDSPFGHLDPTYRRGVAEFLPELASQVLLFVSTSQASEAVMEKLSDKIDMQYVLTRNNQSSGKGKQVESLEINGKSYDLTTYDSEIEGTVINEVQG